MVPKLALGRIWFTLFCLYFFYFIFFFGGTTARGGPWPLLHYASRPPDPLICLSIRLFPSFSGPWTRHPAISFLVFLFVLLHTAFRTSFWSCGFLHSFYVSNPSCSLVFNEPDNSSPLIIASNSSFRRISIISFLHWSIYFPQYILFKYC